MIENLEKIENDRKVIADEILNKLKASEIKRNTFQEKNEEKLNEKNEKLKEKLMSIKDKIKEVEDKRNEKNNDTLHKQIFVLRKAQNMEDVFLDTKSTLYEDTIVKQIGSERKMTEFFKLLNAEKSKSLLKKDGTQKKGLYIDLKRRIAEEERKKKGSRGKEK